MYCIMAVMGPTNVVKHGCVRVCLCVCKVFVQAVFSLITAGLCLVR